MGQERSLNLQCIGSTELVTVHEKLIKSHSFESVPFPNKSTCKIWSETGATWHFPMKIYSKEFTVSFDFKWFDLLPESSSDLEKNTLCLISCALEVGLAISLKLQMKLRSWSYKAKQNKREKNV